MIVNLSNLLVFKMTKLIILQRLRILSKTINRAMMVYLLSSVDPLKYKASKIMIIEIASS